MILLSDWNVWNTNVLCVDFSECQSIYHLDYDWFRVSRLIYYYMYCLTLKVVKFLDIVSLTLNAMQDLDRFHISHDEVTGRSKRHAYGIVQTTSYTPDVLT